jgi:large subunit ribosomal protein L9
MNIKRKKTMSVSLILTHDVRGLGSVGDRVEAKRGFGHYLDRSRKALFSTTENKKLFLEKQEELIQKAQKKREDAQILAQKLQDRVLTFRMMAGDSGKLFGVISSRNIVKELNNEGFSMLKQHHIILDRPISNTGRYMVKIGFEGIDTTLEVNVISSAIAAAEEDAQEQQNFHF